MASRSGARSSQLSSIRSWSAPVDVLEPDQENRVSLVVPGLEVRCGVGTDEKLLFFRFDPNRERTSACRSGLSQAKSFPSTLNAGCP
jgi:hypothetical protein